MHRHFVAIQSQIIQGTVGPEVQDILYEKHETECNNAIPTLFRSNNSDLQNSTRKNKTRKKQEKRV